MGQNSGERPADAQGPPKGRAGLPSRYLSGTKDRGVGVFMFTFINPY